MPATLADALHLLLDQYGMVLIDELERILRENYLHEARELKEADLVAKAYSPKEAAAVRRKKTEEYGTEETFAVPKLRSYPLTKHGKPDAERVLAAWRYLHQRRNREKLSDAVAKQAEARIRRFAAKHFPDIHLADKKEGSPTSKPAKKSTASARRPARSLRKALPPEVYVFPELRQWPLTKGRLPNERLIQKAWKELHSPHAQAALGDALIDQAEMRVEAFATLHHIELPDADLLKSLI